MYTLLSYLIQKRHVIIVGIFTVFTIQVFTTTSAFAVPVIGFNPGHIIDDAIFTNKNSMDPTQIQNFLNTKGSNCSDGEAPCLKNYSEGGRSAAQIIYDTAQQYTVNPQTLIVVLQKEVGLVTMNQPGAWRYRTAMGYGCPDTAACDTQYYGFTNQMRWAATMYHAIMTDSPTWYTPYDLGDNNIKWNPSSSCGTSVVTIDNRATQALYSYTPYRPNQAALDAGYGTGDSCSSYGNRNFYQYFSDWFGAVSNPSFYVAVIKSSNSPALYLQTSAGKYYIPSGEILHAWNLDQYPVKDVSQQYVDSLPTGDWVDRLLKDDWGNLFMVDNGKLHYIPSTNYSRLWNFDTTRAVRSTGLVYSLPGDTWTGRFAQDVTNPNGQIWLIDKGQKRAVASNDMLYQWGYTSNQLTTLSPAYLASLTTGSTVSRYGQAGGVNYLVDTGRRLKFQNGDVESAYYGSQSASPYDAMTLALIPESTVDQFGIDPQGKWYMFENGNKHYIPSGSIAALWGKRTTPSQISQGFITSIPDTGNLTHIVQTSNPSMYWLIDGTKHYLKDSATANAWLASGITPPLYSTQSVNLLYKGEDATTTINGRGSPYTYGMDRGTKRYLTTSQARNAWSDTTFNATNELVGTVPEGSFVNYIVKNSAGQAFLLMNGQSYTIDPDFYDVWGANSSTPKVADETLTRFTLSGTVLKAFIRIGNVSYIMTNGGVKVPIKTFADAYQPQSLGEVTLSNDYFTATADASYLVKSSNSADSRVWFINQGKKTVLTFSQQVSYGYLSRGLAITTLSPATLSIIPDDSKLFSLLIKKNDSGIKLLNFGTALGFPDGDILSRFISPDSGILTVSDSIYNSILLNGSVTKIIKDDQGKIYLMENGQKRWITNGAAYQAYKSIQVSYLFGTTISLIANGPSID